MGDVRKLAAAMRAACDPTRRAYLATYFRPRSPSRFPGLTAVAARRVAYQLVGDFPLAQLRSLLARREYEYRFVALEMLVRRYERGAPVEKQRIAELYLAQLHHVDHWVLVDTSAPYILGDYLLHRRRTILFTLAASRSVAERRIAMVATWTFIKARDFDDTLELARLLRDDEQPLIQRAVGWMLREVGKRSRAVAEQFLNRHAPAMPRQMLRSAVERLPAASRRRYLRLSSRRGP
jgi:3-methyladenine DNA glycosylase AlkD